VTAALLQLRAEARSHWRGWLALIGLSGLLLGVGLACLDGATRADSSVARLHRSTLLADVFIDWFDDTPPTLRRRVAALPEIAATTTTRAYSVTGLAAVGSGVAGSVTVFGDTDPRAGRDLDLNHLVAGRQLDPRRPDDVIADTAAASTLGIGVGDRLTLSIAKVRVRVRVVGIRARIWSSGSPGYLELGPAFYRRYDRGRNGMSMYEEVAYRLRRGAADVAAFRSATERLLGKTYVPIYVSADDEAVRQRELSVSASGVRIAAAFVLAATALLALLAVIQLSRREDAAHRTLAALGATTTDLARLGALRGATLGAGAGVAACAVAVALSPLFPLGEAHGVDPATGLRFDPIMAAGIPAAALAFGLAGLAAMLRSGRPATRRGAARRLTRLRLSLPISLRIVLVGHVPGRRTAIAGAAAAAAAATAALTFSASLDHLGRHPELFGVRWDAVVVGGPPNVAEALRADPDVADAAGETSDVTLDVGGLSTGISSFDRVKGDLGLTLLAGRAATTADEIVLAPRTAAAISRKVGDVVTVQKGAVRASMRIVGIAVLAETGDNGLGHGAALTHDGLARLQPGVGALTYVVRFRPGVDHRAAMRRLGVGPPETPGAVSRLVGLDAVPDLLAGIVALAAAGELAHALLGSVRRRREELAVLKALGLSPTQVLLVVANEALLLGLVGVAAGVPLGLLTGRWAWRAAAERLDVASVVVVPTAQIVVAGAAALVVAGLVALPIGARAAATPPAEILLRDVPA
jgi:hypothetical protein